MTRVLPTETAVAYAQRLLDLIPYDTESLVFTVLLSVHLIAVVLSAGMSVTIALLMRRGMLVMTRVPALWKQAAWLSVLTGLALVAAAPYHYGTSPLVLAKLPIVILALIVTRRGIRTGGFKRSWALVLFSTAFWLSAVVLGQFVENGSPPV